MTGPPGTISNISDTARWVAFYRAMESERRDALFHDPFARRLAGAQGEAIVRSIRGGRMTSWPMVVRTVLIDEIVTRLVAQQGVDTVLNLAAGLDARPWRLPLPERLRWIDADLPEILDYKLRTLGSERARCDYRAERADLRDPERRAALFADVAAGAKQVLILSEGLLVYLEPDQVRALATDLHRQPSFRWWTFDLSGPRILKILERRWGRQLAAGNAPFRFGPAEGTAFFAPLGWKEAEFHSMWENSLRLKRSIRFAWFWHFFSRFSPPERRRYFRRMSGIVVVERA